MIRGEISIDDTISIHAPTRGATTVGCCLHFNHIYFNPRSHERSDTTCAPYALGIIDFNPRSHERSDAKIFSLLVAIIISIHAPTRGATQFFSKFLYLLYFNPRSHERSDAKKIINARLTRFQSTLPREERLLRQVQRLNTLLFQSTLPREERRGRQHIMA